MTNGCQFETVRVFITWAAEIGNGVIRMKKETQPSHENNGKHGGSVFASGRKWALGAKSGIETPLCQRITGTDWKKDLQTGGTGRESKKRPALVVGKKPYGKSQTR